MLRANQLKLKKGVLEDSVMEISVHDTALHISESSKAPATSFAPSVVTKAPVSVYIEKLLPAIV
jgi:hypothetical protein